MILINLLPHREEKRRQRKRAFFAALGACAALGLVIAGIWYLVLMQMTSAQQARNDFFKAEIAPAESADQGHRHLASRSGAEGGQKAVEGLQTDRDTPVYLLDELVKQTPEGVYLTSIKQTGQAVLISGMAQTNERVSEFLRNTLYNSPWLERPELVEIKTAQRRRRRRGRHARPAPAERVLDAPDAEAPAGRRRLPRRRRAACRQRGREEGSVSTS